MKTNDHHHNLINGKGKCSVPMWCMGVPSGFCDKDAFGEQLPSQVFRDAYTGKLFRSDGKYNGYVPGLCCPMHGGPACPGFEIEPGAWSGCSGTGGDCPTCGK